MTGVEYPSSRGAGWITFAGIMLTFAGAMTVIDGIVALGKSRFLVGDAVYVFSDVRTWGWIMLGLGTLTLVAAAGVLDGSQVGRWLGVTLASLNAIGQLLFLPAYPWWAVCVFAVDVLVVYALVAYGGRGPVSIT